MADTTDTADATDTDEGLTHIDARGDARMVDVGRKDVTEREAIARGALRMHPDTLSRLLSGDTPKGDVLACARIAGIQAAKKTAELIPLCHVLPLSGCRVTLAPDEANARVEIEARVRVVGRTGVEMEALTAVSVAALTLYDMLKAIDRDMVIEDIRVMEKRGGRRGEYIRGEGQTP